MAQSIGQILDRDRGLGKGFGFLRVSMAFGVLTWHAQTVANGGQGLSYDRGFWFGGYAILFVFFALSGFLISGSAMRLSLRDFLINRTLRIFPALTVEIVLSAFILGPLFTALPLHTYFSSPLVYHYFTNIIGLMNYRLPGVFIDHPNPMVNASLWTVPYEIGCYIIMSGLITFGLLRCPKLVVLVIIALLGAGMAMVFVGAHGPSLGGRLRSEAPVPRSRFSPLRRVPSRHYRLSIAIPIALFLDVVRVGDRVLPGLCCAW